MKFEKVIQLQILIWAVLLAIASTWFLVTKCTVNVDINVMQEEGEVPK